jgi:ATP-binding cassette, subfamily B, multidrug efflux pump
MLGLLKTHLAPYRGRLIVVMALLLVQAIGNLYLPDLNADIINRGVATGDVNHILWVGSAMLLVTLALAAVSILSVYLGARTSMAFGRDLRAAIFRRVTSFAQTEVNAFGTPSLITRNTNDVQQVQQVVMMALNMMILSPMMAIGGVIMAIRQDVPLSSLLIVVLPLMAAFIGVMLGRAMPLFKAMQVKIDRINQVMRESLSGVRVIRAFMRNDLERSKFSAANVDLTDTTTRVNRIFALMIPTLFGILNLSMVAVMWFGGLRIASGAMPIGNLTAFLTYIAQILISVMMATAMFAMVPRAAASAERIQAVLETEPSVCDPQTPAEASATRGHVDVRDVEFRYPGAEHPVLCNISFSAHPGETTAIVGSTGSGKSTLVNLIPRFYDVTGGSVLIDGVDVRDMRQADLWARIGFIPQRSFLFSGTIASNVRYGAPDATDEEVWAALRTAQAADFVAEMDGGLEAAVSQGGANVSGGQRQRLAIARALVKRPGVYVFDDSFSALDFKTDSALRSALKSETSQSTVLIVAQRVSTILHADRIVVMDGGTVVGIGKHRELMDSCETYREIVYSQLTEEEISG